MAQVTDFLAMGGYAVFVWPAYAATLIVLTALAVSSLRTFLRRQRELRRIEARLAQNGEGKSPKGC